MTVLLESEMCGALPIAFLLRQDDVFGTEVSEQSDRGLLTARGPAFVQRMVIIIHLQHKH